MASVKRTQPSSKLRISSTADANPKADQLKPRLIESLASTTSALKNLFRITPSQKLEEKEFIVSTPPALHRSNSSRYGVAPICAVLFVDVNLTH
jgi:hypothetical protein